MATVPFDRTSVVGPEALGLDPGALDAFRARVQQSIDDGTTPSAQFAFARDGEVGVYETMGAAEPGSRYVIFSATKAMVAGAVWILMGEGEIDVDRRVAEVIPEFGSNGKDVITIEQVMLHTSGFPRA